MVDSVKNYGLAGASTVIELGKEGSKIDASDSAVISIKRSDDALQKVAIANGTASSHAVTKAQLDNSTSQKIQYISTTVNYNSGTVAIGTAAANTHVQKVIVEKGAGNWTNANSTTEIIVGDAGDTDRLFSGFEPGGGQHIFENDHTYSSSTAISAIVTQGAAEGGSATIKVFYAGVIS